MASEKNTAPLVSVLLPVYNAAAYLASAIESILNQTFRDYELILINDGSTDDSLSIILSFKDERIKLITNPKNIGLIESLNKGIDLAAGKYIARMDADDISLPERFAKQINYLEKNPNAAVVATRIALINFDSEITGHWDDDTEFVSAAAIRRGTAFTNRIAHPSIMARSVILKKYKYRSFQKNAEDWDLWLRLLADGHEIHKIDEVLLHYRIHPQSVMSTEKETILQQRLIRTKRKFLIHQLPKINSYFFLVKYSLLRSIASHLKYNLIPDFLRAGKRIFNSSPFAVLNQYNQLKNVLATHKTDLLFFFPYTHIGGAERVHADIVSVFKDQRPIVIFTAFSKNKKFLSRFSENALVLNIPDAVNYPVLRNKILHLLSEFINKQHLPCIVGSNSGYLFDLAPLLSQKVLITDIIHAFKYQPKGNLAHKKNLPVSQKFANRIFISSAALAEFKEFCFHQNYTKEYIQKLKLIYNCTTVPGVIAKNYTDKLNILFVGRDSDEKRMNLFVELARNLDREIAGGFTFTVIGAKGSDPLINFLGEINNDEEITRHYQKAHILVLTSSREGFPLVIMEAMANGVVPVSTPVGDIPTHVQTDRGIITSSANEKTVVDEMKSGILELYKDRKRLETLSTNAHNYAQQNFSKERFAREYKTLLKF